MCTRVLIALFAALVLMAPAYAKPDLLQVVVADPYIEMRTGPGRGYPIFHVADRGAQIEVVKKRTDWYEVRTDRGISGWVNEEQLARTLETTGEPVSIEAPGWSEFSNRHWETTLSFGDFDGASSIALTGGYRFTPNLAVELMAADLSGDYSDGWLGTVRLVHTPFPDWRISPYFLLGTGVLHVSPRASLVSTEDRTDQVAQAGVGVRAWLTRQFMFRAEYSGYVAFTSRDDNEGVDAWQAGIAFFF
jgi:uncharacterized protein YgiM (DUF1202 family)